MDDEASQQSGTKRGRGRVGRRSAQALKSALARSTARPDQLRRPAFTHHAVQASQLLISRLSGTRVPVQPRAPQLTATEPPLILCCCDCATRLRKQPGSFLSRISQVRMPNYNGLCQGRVRFTKTIFRRARQRPGRFGIEMSLRDLARSTPAAAGRRDGQDEQGQFILVNEAAATLRWRRRRRRRSTTAAPIWTCCAATSGVKGSAVLRRMVMRFHLAPAGPDHDRNSDLTRPTSASRRRSDQLFGLLPDTKPAAG